MIELQKFTIDTEYNEPYDAENRRPMFSARVVCKGTTMDASPGQNLALFDIACDARVMVATRFYASGSTTFPDAIGNGRIYIAVTPFIAPAGATALSAFGYIKIVEIDWALIRIA